MKQTNKKLKDYYKLKHKWFTLVELIIVITILAILATIAFVSFGNYTKDARDANRMTTLKTIEKWISIVESKTWYYPEPEEWVEIWTWNIIYIIQWVIWDNIAKEIKLNQTNKDPKTKDKYIYLTNKSKTKYQLLSFTENESNSNGYGYIYDKIINKTYADNVVKPAFILWYKLWIFFETNWEFVNKINYSSWLDLSSNENKNKEFIVYFSNDKENWKYTWSWNTLVEKIIEVQESDWGKVWEQKPPITYSWEWNWNDANPYKFKNSLWEDIYPSSCNDLLVSNEYDYKTWNTSFNQTKFVNWIYYIKPEDEIIKKVYCEMNFNWGWWTRVKKVWPITFENKCSYANLPFDFNNIPHTQALIIDDWGTKTDLYKPWGNNNFDILWITPYLNKIIIDNSTHLRDANIYEETTPCKRENNINIDTKYKCWKKVIYNIPKWKKAFWFWDSESILFPWSCWDNYYYYNFSIYLR